MPSHRLSIKHLVYKIWSSRVDKCRINFVLSSVATCDTHCCFNVYYEKVDKSGDRSVVLFHHSVVFTSFHLLYNK